MSFKVNGIIMPQSSSNTSTFSIETYDISTKDSLKYMVDKTSINNLLVASFGTITNVSIVPSTFTANRNTMYTFSFVPSHNVVKNGKILIVFPPEI